MGRVEYLPRQADPIPDIGKSFDHLFEKFPMFSYREPFDVFENEVGRVKFFDYTDEFANERVSRILECAMSDQGKSLARSSSENDIDTPIADIGLSSDFFSGQIGYRQREHDAFWKIIFVNGRIDRIDFDGGDDIEPGLFETEAQPSGSRK